MLLNRLILQYRLRQHVQIVIAPPCHMRRYRPLHATLLIQPGKPSTTAL